ncbi:MAG: hypothetical protein IKP68_05000 [Clostridia bacterium]|nr:hypothetical protein [Clostridia bacterium]
MGLLYILIGCVFLFDPIYNLIDVPPDFVGVALILYGMSRLADLNSHVFAAYSKMRSAAFVTFAKLVCMALIGVFDPTMRTTLTLGFGVLECVFLIPALTELFEGFSALATGNVEINEKISSGIKPLTAVFFILRAVGSVLPDAARMIYETSGGAVKPNAITPEMLWTILITVSLVLTTLCGAFWLYHVFGFINPARKNREFVASLEKRYADEILSNDQKMTSRRVGRFCLLASLSLIPFVTLRVDGIYFLPEFAFGIVMLVANLITKKYAQDKKLTALLISFTAVAAAEYAVMMIYSPRFGDAYMPFGKDGFIPLYAALVALAAAMFILFAVCGKRIADVLGKMTADTVGLGGNYTDDRRRDIDAEQKKKIFRRIKFAEVVLYIYAAVGVAAVAALPFFEAAWLARLTAGVILFSVWLWVTRTVSAEAENTL